MPPEQQTNEIDPTPSEQGRTPLSEFMTSGGNDATQATQTQQRSGLSERQDTRVMTGQQQRQGLGEFQRQPDTQQQQQDNRNFLQKATDFVLPGVRGFGESIAGAAPQSVREGGADIDEANQRTSQMLQDVTQEIRERRARGEDTSRLERAAANLANEGFIDPAQLNQALQKSNRQVLGEALGTAASTVGFSALPGAARFASGGGSFLSGLGRGAAVGAGEGALFGATEGFASGLRDDQTVGESARRAGTGALVGTAAGGILGGAAGGIGGALAGRQARKAELRTLMNNQEAIMRPADGLPQSSVIQTEDTSRLARFMQDEAGDITKDPEARTLLSGAPNIDEAEVIAIKSAGEVDRSQKFPRMIDIANRASQNRRVVERPTDVVGETFVNYSQKISDEFQNVSKQLDEVAQELDGQSVNIVQAENSFLDELQSRGVRLTEEGNLADDAFQGSDFEDMPQVEKLIRTVDNRLRNVNDAQDAHRLKKFIDNQVEYGKSKEGLVGDAERVVKNLRRQVDQQLDNRFTRYNEVNTEASQLINTINEMGEILGNNFNIYQLDDAINNIRAGQAARRILGNSQKRGEVLRALEVVQEQAKKRGADDQGDLVSQTIFADILEDIYGTQATTGFQGGVERGTREGIQESADVIRGLMQQGVRGAGGALIQKGARAIGGTTQDEVTQALQRLISR